MKKFFSRLMRGTLRKRSAVKRHRALAFERMEDRLALSTTTGGLELNANSVYLATTIQGGIVAFYNSNTFVVDKASVSSLLDIAGNRAVLFRSFPRLEEIRESAIFTFDTNGAFLFGEAASFDSDDLAVIPHPTFGNGETSGGIVAIGKIYEISPLVAPIADPAQNVAAVPQSVATPVLASTESPLNDFSLSRGRDMYFDVAANESRPQATSGADRSSVTPISFQPTAHRQEPAADASKAPFSTSAATRRGAATSQVRSAHVLTPSVPALQAVPTVSERETTSSPEQDSPQGDEVSAVDARDEVFADWRRRELSATDEALPLRTEEADEQSSAWPILAALAVGGMVVRSRRTANNVVFHQQPPRRKSLAKL